MKKVILKNLSIDVINVKDIKTEIIICAKEKEFGILIYRTDKYAQGYIFQFTDSFCGWHGFSNSKEKAIQKCIENGCNVYAFENFEEAFSYIFSQK